MKTQKKRADSFRARMLVVVALAAVALAVCLWTQEDTDDRIDLLRLLIRSAQMVKTSRPKRRMKRQ